MGSDKGNQRSRAKELEPSHRVRRKTEMVVREEAGEPVARPQWE